MSDANRTAIRYAKEDSFAEPIGGAYATGTITLTGVGTAADTVTVNGTVYTLRTSLSAARDVLIGATAALTARALCDAINASQSTIGTLFHSATTEHTTVWASLSGAVITVTAKARGTGGNSYTLAETSTGVTISGATLSGASATDISTVKEQRYVSDTLNHKKVTVESEEIRSDRTSSGLIKVGISADGDIVFESHYSDLLDFRQSAIQQPAVTGSTSEDMTISSDGFMSAAAGDFAGSPNIFKAKWLKLSGFANAANNGLKRVIGRVANTIQLENVVAEVGTTSAAEWSFSRQGGGEGLTLESYMIEKEITDAGIVIPMIGMCVNTWALNMPARGKVTETFGFLGYGLPTGSTTRTDSAGGTVTDPSTDPILNTTTNLNKLLLDGYPADAYIESMDFTLNNNLRERLALQREGTLEPGSGQSMASGNMKVYFDNKQMYDKYLAHTAIAVEFALRDADGRQFSVYMPKVQRTDGTYATPGINQDIFLQLAFKAERGVGHDGEEFQLQVDFLEA